jgi:hypothetical protein
MYISRVRLENIRGFSGRVSVRSTFRRPDGSHAGWTVLAGRNGSGKTSLLRAIALSVGGLLIAPNLIPDFRTWMTAGLPDSSTELQVVAAPEDFQPENGQRARDLEVTMRWAVDADRETSRPGSQPVMSSDISINPSDEPTRSDGSAALTVRSGVSSEVPQKRSD